MAEKSLSERLAESKGQPIEYEGRAVHASYHREVHSGDVLFVRFIKSAGEARQGLSISLKKGALRVNEQSLRDVVLWKDTAPELVEIVCQTPKQGAVLSVWNAWDRSGILQAWLRNAGMLVEEQDDAVILRCSDGVGPPDFGDLVVELKFVCPHKN